MRKFCEAQIRTIILSTKENGEGMAQEFSHPTRCQRPQVTRPNALGMEAFHELTEDGFDAVAQMGQKAWKGLLLAFGGLVRS